MVDKLKGAGSDDPIGVYLSKREQKKGKHSQTKFDFEPTPNSLDSALLEAARLIGRPIYITSGDRSDATVENNAKITAKNRAINKSGEKINTEGLSPSKLKDITSLSKDRQALGGFASEVNHNNQRARDIGKASNPDITKAEWKIIAKHLASKGFRVGDEWGTKAPHLHVDSFASERHKTHFSRGKKSIISEGAKEGAEIHKKNWMFDQYDKGNQGTKQLYNNKKIKVDMSPQDLADYTIRDTSDKQKSNVQSVQNKDNLEYLEENILNSGKNQSLETQQVPKSTDIEDFRSQIIADDNEEASGNFDTLVESLGPNQSSEVLSRNIVQDEKSFKTLMSELASPLDSTNDLETGAIRREEFGETIKGLAFIKPEDGERTSRNVASVLNREPENYIPQITSETPILADTGDIEITQGEGLATDDFVESIDTEKAEVEDLSFEGDLGAQPQDFDTVISDLEDLTFEGMGDDLVNNFVDRSAVGFLTEGAIRKMETTGIVDRSFSATEDDLYPELTKGLDNEDLEEVLENSNNRHDFIINATLAQARNKRTEEMTEYSANHPVLSGVNAVGNILAEGAIFMPVSSLASAALGATKIRKASQLLKTSRLANYAAGEIIEQGLQEVIWANNAKDYEFDPVLFGLAVSAGVGLKSLFGTPELEASFRKFLKDEKGFINIATENGKKLVDEVAKKIGTEQAISLAEAITKRKAFAANSIRKNLLAKRDGYVKALGKITRQMKAAKKDKALYKKLKGKKQNLTRKIKAFDKALPNQLSQLAKGTHPKLSATVNPKLSISEVAKTLGIDSKLVNSPDKIRKYLGLDSPKIDPSFIVEGEKPYQVVARTQLNELAKNARLNANETLKYIAGTDTVKSIDKLPLLGRLQVGDKLKALAETDGPISRFLFNKGNLVSSDNPLISAFYNWLAPDGMGRQGMSKIRAIESQQKYANIYGGYLMDIYNTHGDKLYKLLEGDTLTKKAKSFFSPDSFEDTVEPIFKDRLLLGREGFKAKYGDDIAKIADEFADDFNKLNKKINDRAKEVGVEGVDFDATDDWFHRSWDFRKARAVDQEDLEDTVFRAMKSHAEKLGVESIDEAELLKKAKSFAFGLRNADLSKVEEANSKWIEFLSKLANKADGDEAKVIKGELARLKDLKAKNDAGDLANRVQLDVNTQTKGGLKLADLFEDNVVHTQKKYTARMSARIAAAEHGIKNLDDMDDWISDAVAMEIKRLAAKGVKDPASSVKFIETAMRQDLSSFKYGGMVGLHDMSDDSANAFIRLVQKYNYARLMQYTGLSSIAEVGGTFVEAGVATTLGELSRTMRQHFNDLWSDNPEKYVDRLYDELRTITGVGMEDFSFSTKGVSKATRIIEDGVGNTFEKGIDVLGRITHGTFGGIEKVGRRMTANALAIKWSNHFMGTEKGGLLSAFFGSNGVTNRVLENSGFGRMTKTGKFIPNKTYKDIQKSIKKFATFDDNGNLVKLNLEKWKSETAHSFGDAIQMQSNHIMVNPDATTMALWQSTSVGRILNQFRTFTVNATTKVAGQTFANAAISSNRGDQSEMIKAGQKIFWGTSLGMLSVALRQGIQRAGGDKEIDLFDEGLMKASAIGFSRSSVAGNIPTLIDSIGGRFGVDPIFEKTSSMGRSKNFFNIATTPTGQAVGGVLKSVDKAGTGDFKGAGMQLMKTSPLYRQIGAQQLFNFIDDEK